MGRRLFGFFFLLLVFSSFVFAEGENLTIQEKASLCINISQDSINYLASEGYSTLRVGDLLNESREIYLAQSALLEKSGKANFDLIIRHCDEIAFLKDSAFSTRDSYNALVRFFEESISSDLDSTEIKIALEEIDSEIKNERYEKVPELVDAAYDKISLFKSENTRIKLLYKNTATGITGFFVNNWKTLSIILACIVIGYFLFRKAIARALLNRRLNALLLRKRMLKELIKKAQQDYFQAGSLSQAVFEIKIKNFGTLVRDIDRQIPLLNEELTRVSSKTRKNGNV